MDGVKWLIGILFWVLGAYIGGYVMFVGGIVDVIEQIRAEHLESMKVAIGIAKVVFCGIGFWIPALIGNLFISSTRGW